MKAIILARVSTEEQREAGNSLPAQIERLKNYCLRKGFEIVETFSFDESAYKTKRDEFDKILEYLKEHKEKIAVCFDKVDRLSRNVFDKRVSLLYEKAVADEIELHFASDGQIVDSSMSAVEKFHFGVSLGLAKYYSDAISDNVKRVFEQKIRRGEWTGKAPVGYENVKRDGKSWIQPDSARSHLIAQLFEWYATGNYSMGQLRKMAYQEGLTNNTPLRQPLARSQIERVLKNPFYYGEMLYKGQLYPHYYERLTTKEQYDQVQAVREGWHKKRFQYAAKPFTFRGLITCAHCGCTVSFQFKKGKYVYGRCTKARTPDCPAKWIKEEELMPQATGLLRDMSIPETVLPWLVGKLRKSHEVKKEYHEKTMASLEEEYARIQNRIAVMYEDRLDGRITPEMYDKKLKDYKQRQQYLIEQKEHHRKADEVFYVEGSKVLELASRAHAIFESSKPEQKRVLLKFLLQNSQLRGKRLEINLNQPFDAILVHAKTRKWLPG